MHRRQACLLAALTPLAAPAATSLHVWWMFSSGAQRTLWLRTSERFTLQHNAVQLVSRELEQSTYKQEFAQLLSAPQQEVDVAFWFAGQRLRDYVDQGLIEPLDELAKSERWDQKFTPAALDAVRMGGRIYALPLATYQWGFYYRRSLFKRLGLQPPANWDEWLKLNDQLHQAGIAPISLGAKDGWPLGAWFDYLNLRLHGKDFHLDLMAGRASWLDARVVAVFTRWRQLIERGDFLAGAAERDWQQALPYLSRELAGMVLMGNFLLLRLPAAVRDDLGFFPFPVLDPKQPGVEEAPLDVLLIPRRTRQKKLARDFIRYMGRAEVQSVLNAEMGLIPPHRQAVPSANSIVQAGARLLAQARGSTQFFDRDSPARFSGPALGLLQSFFSNPQRQDALLQELEALRLNTIGVPP